MNSSRSLRTRAAMALLLMVGFYGFSLALDFRLTARNRDRVWKLAAELDRLVVESGAHFVKTSTGFASSGATTHVVQLLRECVGPSFGVKASGGIRDAKIALGMIESGATRLGTSAGVQIMQGLSGGGAY